MKVSFDVSNSVYFQVLRKAQRDKKKLVLKTEILKQRDICVEFVFYRVILTVIAQAFLYVLYLFI